jgi:molybdate transport system regulatory protein
MHISARNRILADIVSINKGAVNAKVMLRTPQGTELSAIITLESSVQLRLAEGETVTAFFKASNVLVATGAVPNISARNKLQGRVETVLQGAVNAELILRLGSGDAVSSIITNEALNELHIRENTEVTAIIKASDVMIAK